MCWVSGCLIHWTEYIFHAQSIFHNVHQRQYLARRRSVDKHCLHELFSGDIRAPPAATQYCNSSSSLFVRSFVNICLGPISWKWLESERLGTNGPLIGNSIWRIERSGDRWRHTTLDVWDALSRKRLEIQIWSRARWRHVTLKRKGEVPDILRIGWRPLENR